MTGFRNHSGPGFPNVFLSPRTHSCQDLHDNVEYVLCDASAMSSDLFDPPSLSVGHTRRRNCFHQAAIHSSSSQTLAERRVTCPPPTRGDEWRLGRSCTSRQYHPPVKPLDRSAQALQSVTPIRPLCSTMRDRRSSNMVPLTPPWRLEKLQCRILLRRRLRRSSTPVTKCGET